MILLDKLIRVCYETAERITAKILNFVETFISGVSGK